MIQDKTALKFVVLALTVILTVLIGIVLIVTLPNILNPETVDVNTVIGAPKWVIP